MYDVRYTVRVKKMCPKLRAAVVHINSRITLHMPTNVNRAVYDLIFGCTRDVQENFAIGLVIFQSAEILGFNHVSQYISYA